MTTRAIRQPTIAWAPANSGAGMFELDVEGGQRRRGGERPEQQRRGQAQKLETADQQRGEREQRGPSGRRPQPAAHTAAPAALGK